MHFSQVIYSMENQISVPFCTSHGNVFSNMYRNSLRSLFGALKLILCQYVFIIIILELGVHFIKKIRNSIVKIAIQFYPVILTLTYYRKIHKNETKMESQLFK